MLDFFTFILIFFPDTALRLEFFSFMNWNRINHVFRHRAPFQDSVPRFPFVELLTEPLSKTTSLKFFTEPPIMIALRDTLDGSCSQSLCSRWPSLELLTEPLPKMAFLKAPYRATTHDSSPRYLFWKLFTEPLSMEVYVRAPKRAPPTKDLPWCSFYKVFSKAPFPKWPSQTPHKTSRDMKTWSLLVIIEQDQIFCLISCLSLISFSTENQNHGQTWYLKN